MSIEQDARAGAEKQWPVPQGPIDDYRMGRHHGFIRGYIAGATRPVTDAEVKRAAVMFGGVRTMAWDVAEDWEKEHVLRQMRLALEAAREAS